MKIFTIIKIYTIIFFLVLISSCSSIQKEWKTNGATIEKDVISSKKHGLMIFTTSDSDPQSEELLKNVFTDKLFSKINKEFIFYNIDIVKDEKLIDSIQLEKNYLMFSNYNITQVPYICLMNKYGDIYHSSLIPQEIDSSELFFKYLNKLKEKGENVEILRKNINEAEGIEKIKTINKFFESIYLVDSEKYRSFFEEGIKSDPSNKSGLLGSFIIGRMQLNIAPLLKQKKYKDIIDEFNKTIDTKMLTAEEEQGILCNIAYFYSHIPNMSTKKIIEYLELAFKIAPNSPKASTIKEDIEYLKNKN